MIETAIQELTERKNLNEEKARRSMEEIMEGKATGAQISAFLVALKMKGETAEEITGFAQCMRDHCVRINPNVKGLVDTCGTGGDTVKTFNISTVSMFVVAGAGIPIAKHGNRSVTSVAGSADVLEALGVALHLNPSQVEAVIQKIGIGFMFAPHFHPAMKHALPIRKTLKIRTVFNILGPLTNPADAEHHLLGVYAPEILKKVAYALKTLGTSHSFVVHGEGMDEVTTLGKTLVAEVTEKVRFFEIRPRDFGVEKAVLGDLKSFNIGENAKIIYNILRGEKGPKRDIVTVNAALGILAGEKADGLKKAVEIAEESIDSGKAFEKLEMLVKEGGNIEILEKFGD